MKTRLHKTLLQRLMTDRHLTREQFTEALHGWSSSTLPAPGPQAS
jgi:hypothetical protein